MRGLWMQTKPPRVLQNLAQDGSSYRRNCCWYSRTDFNRMEEETIHSKCTRKACVPNRCLEWHRVGSCQRNAPRRCFHYSSSKKSWQIGEGCEVSSEGTWMPRRAYSCEGMVYEYTSIWFRDSWGLMLGQICSLPRTKFRFLKFRRFANLCWMSSFVRQ